MKKQTPLKILIILFIATLSLNVGNRVFAQNPVSLAYKLRAGDVLTYKQEMEITAEAPGATGENIPGSTKTETEITFIVTDVGNEGLIVGGSVANTRVVSALYRGVDITSAMSEQIKQQGMQTQLLLFSMYKNGKMTILPQQAEQNLTGWLVFPDKPIKIGESWTQELSHQIPLPQTPGLKVSLTATLLSFQQVGRYNTVQNELTTPKRDYSGSEESEGKFTIFFAENEGIPVKVEGATTQRMGANIPGEIKTRVDMELTKRERLSKGELKQARKELQSIETAIKTVEEARTSKGAKSEYNKAQTALQKFKSTYPKSRWLQGVEGLILRFAQNQFSSGEQEPEEKSPMTEELPDSPGNPSRSLSSSEAKDSRASIDEYMSSLGIAKSDGKEASDFTLNTLEGKSVSLSDYRGKIVFLNFWATWCPPCRREMPSMEKLYQKFKDEDFVMLAVDLRESQQKVKKFMEDYKLNFLALLDSNGKVGNAYSVWSIPTTYLIGRGGQILGKAVGARDWANEDAFNLIEELLKVKS